MGIRKGKNEESVSRETLSLLFLETGKDRHEGGYEKTPIYIIVEKAG